MQASLAESLTPEVQRSQAELETLARREPEASLSWGEFLDRARASKGVLWGSFHTCPELLRSQVRWTRDLLELAPVSLALPFFQEGPPEPLLLARSWPPLRDYLEELSETWPFPLEPYQELEAGFSTGHLEVFLFPGPRQESFPEKAERVRSQFQALRKNSRALALAWVGELLLGPELGADPSEEGVLRVLSGSRPTLGREQFPEGAWAQDLGSNVFSFAGASPLRLVDSFENWRHQEPELPWPAFGESFSDPIERILGDLLRPFVGLLGESAEPPIQRLWLADRIEDWADQVPPEWTPEIAHALEGGGGYFLPSTRTVILGSARLDQAAEEVAHAVHFAFVPARLGLPLGEDFRERVFREAVGFFGSTLFVPDRPAPAWAEVEARFPEWVEVLLDSCEAAGEKLGADGSELPEGYLEAVHCLGYALGKSLELSPLEIRELFTRPLPEDPAPKFQAWIEAARAQTG